MLVEIYRNDRVVPGKVFIMKNKEIMERVVSKKGWGSAPRD
jgi:hypothetical protein